MHKQYIKKRGRVFGPYYYESYRQGNRVKKRYLGKLEKKTLKKKESKHRSSKKHKVLLFIISLTFLVSLISLVLVSGLDPSLNMKINILPGESTSYGTQSVVQAQENNLDDAGCIYNLYRDNTPVQNPDIQVLKPGTYNYVYNTTGCGNYSSGQLAKELVISKLPSKVNLYLNKSATNISVMKGESIDIRAELENPIGNILVYIDGQLIYAGSSPSYNLTSFDKPGEHTIEAYFAGDEYNNETREKLSVFVDMPDLAAPYIRLTSPRDDDNLTEAIDFSYFAEDRSEIKNCTLIVNNKVLYTSNSIQKNSENYFNISYLSPGKYSWQISCADANGNEGTSLLRKFSVVVIAYPGGELESSSGGSLGGIVIVRLNETGGCIEKWLCGEWSQCINDGRTRDCIDLSSCGTENDKPVTKATCDFSKPDVQFIPSFFNLTVREMDSLTFRIVVEEKTGNSSIIVQWFLNSVLMKQDFGIGSLDSILNINATNNSEVTARILSDYYKEVMVWAVETIETDCKENWKCEWTDCESDGYRYPYNCVDENNCSTNADMPYQEKCDCVPEWYCYNWTACIVRHELRDLLAAELVLKGTQKRLCKDLANCQPNKLEEKTCSVEVPVEIKERTWCNETYVELYIENKTVSRIKQKKIHDLRVLDVAFSIADFSGYCDYCYDSIKNYDEEDIDCGGSCKVCAEQLSSTKKIRFNLLEILNVLFLVFLISAMVYILYLRALSFWIIFKRYKAKNF